MIYSEFKGKKLSALGFGTMRLPMKNGKIDEDEFTEMVDFAMEQGVNYFDTAYPYHGGLSEIAIGKALKKYPRESYYLATKFPGHQTSDTYEPEKIFEEQLRKCEVDYFDFYLLHNVYENSLDVYLDKKWGIIDYFCEQKKKGRIRHLGFSTHAKLDCMRSFLDIVADKMEFAQIQLNWMDWTLQNAKEKVNLLNERNIPIWVMEPVRGGKLCKLSESDEKTLNSLRPHEGTPAWGFRFLQGINGVTLTLSGMSNMEQMKENIKTYAEKAPLSSKEIQELLRIAEGMKNSVPCTACSYCTDSCPMSLDIPGFIGTYNDINVEAKTNPTMWIEALPADKQPSSCISCKACEKLCPQSIKIPEIMKKLSEKLEEIPKWSDICRERAEAAKKLQRK